MSVLSIGVQWSPAWVVVLAGVAERREHPLDRAPSSSLAQPIARAATAYATSGMPTGVSRGSSARTRPRGRRSRAPPAGPAASRRRSAALGGWPRPAAAGARWPRRRSRPGPRRSKPSPRAARSLLYCATHAPAWRHDRLHRARHHHRVLGHAADATGRRASPGKRHVWVGWGILTDNGLVVPATPRPRKDLGLSEDEGHPIIAGLAALVGVGVVVGLLVSGGRSRQLDPGPGRRR